MISLSILDLRRSAELNEDSSLNPKVFIKENEGISFADGNWKKNGEPIFTKASDPLGVITYFGGGFGSGDMDVSDDGSVIIVGNSAYSSKTENCGRYSISYYNEGMVRVYGFSAGHWVQKGQTITGIANESENRCSGSKGVGESVCINNRGNIISIGSSMSSLLQPPTPPPTPPPAATASSSNNDKARVTPAAKSKVLLEDCGLVQSYMYDDNTSKWVQFGSVIAGKEAEERLGHTISMNVSGNRFAVTYGGYGDNAKTGIRVYELNPLSGINETNPEKASKFSWRQLGLDILTPNQKYSDIGQLDINAEGDRIVITGAAGTKVYKYNTQDFSWSRLGSILVNDFENYYTRVSMNGVGNRIAIGNALNTGPTGFSKASGAVQVFQLSSNNTWVNMGPIIYATGSLNEQYCGYSVSLNAEGNVLAVGSPSPAEKDLYVPGEVRTFVWTGANWKQLGGSIKDIHFDNPIAKNIVDWQSTFPRYHTEWTGAIVHLDSSGTKLFFSSPLYTEKIYAYGKGPKEEIPSGLVSSYKFKSK